MKKTNDIMFWFFVIGAIIAFSMYFNTYLSKTNCIDNNELYCKKVYTSNISNDRSFIYVQGNKTEDQINRVYKQEQEFRLQQAALCYNSGYEYNEHTTCLKTII